ncbi:MAG: hypothetical protein JWP69_1586 [Flaviaesturariibacter sp.]|nr:hypothetical protein [Flaviaesturariibacter sp.]
MRDLGSKTAKKLGQNREAWRQPGTQKAAIKGKHMRGFEIIHLLVDTLRVIKLR